MHNPSFLFATFVYFSFLFGEQYIVFWIMITSERTKGDEKFEAEHNQFLR